jgi:hypothetical protein
MKTVLVLMIIALTALALRTAPKTEAAPASKVSVLRAASGS